jgi:hypothetical protein
LIEACSRSERAESVVRGGGHVGHQPELSNTQTIAGHSVFEKLSNPPGREATIQASTALKGGPRVVDRSLSRR